MDTDHSSSARRRRGAPPAGERLTRVAVITAATELITRDGLAAFSLRGLADALGVAPNALYNHVRNRDDLLDAVTDGLVTSIRLPGGRQPWHEWVRTAAIGLRSQLIERPEVTELVLARAGSRPTGPALLARFTSRLVSAGVDPAVAHVAWHAMLTVVVGSVVQERARGADREATFRTVLDVVVSGLRAAAEHPPSPDALALLDAHAPAERGHAGGSRPAGA